MDDNNPFNSLPPMQPGQPDSQPTHNYGQQSWENHNQHHQNHHGHHNQHEQHHWQGEHQHHQDQPYHQPAEPHTYHPAHPIHPYQPAQSAAAFVDPAQVYGTQPHAEQYTPQVPPHVPAVHQPGLPASDVYPTAVVQVLSTRGVEYWMMTLALYLGAGGLLAILLAIFNGGIQFEILAFPVSLLLVCLPLFSYLFLRLKKAELMDPRLKFDPSKRRLTQFTQVITFAICLFDIIGIVFAILASIAGHGFGPLWKYLLNSIVVLIVAGGILAYYWIDEHHGRA